MAKIKPRIIETGNGPIERLWVKTRVLNRGDDLIAEVRAYAGGLLKPGDILTIAESPVAAVQGRAIPITEIKPGFWANLLWRFVKKVPYGIGLRSPWSMQCAIDEVGLLRILRAALAGFWGKLRGRSGDFYQVAGKQAAMIDAAHTSGVKEFYECVILGPKDPDGVARQLAEALGCPVAVVDANDIFGCTVVGASDGVDVELVQAAMRDNPAGQGDELTPIIILRPAKSG
jgi:F420-0:gamma-glutamyl ligase